MSAFKTPQTLPQDLLLISEFVDVPEERKQPQRAPENEDDDIASSGSENESEEEIEKDLTTLPEDEEDDGNNLYVSSLYVFHLIHPPFSADPRTRVQAPKQTRRDLNQSQRRKRKPRPLGLRRQCRMLTTTT